MCDGPVPASWMMYSPRSVSRTVEPGGFQGMVEAGLFGGHRLGLDGVGDAVLAGDLQHDAVGVGGGGGPVHLPAGGFQVGGEAAEIDIQVFDGVQADGGGRLAQVFPAGQLGHAGEAPGDETLCGLLHGQRDAFGHMAGVFAKGDVTGGLAAHRVSPSPASRSMMCRARTLEPATRRPPAMFIRQPGSQLTTHAAPEAVISSTLCSIMAWLTAG